MSKIEQPFGLPSTAGQPVNPPNNAGKRPATPPLYRYDGSRMALQSAVIPLQGQTKAKAPAAKKVGRDQKKFSKLKTSFKSDVKHLWAAGQEIGINLCFQIGCEARTLHEDQAGLNPTLTLTLALTLT